MADIHRIGLDEVVRHFEELEDPRSTINRRHPLVSRVGCVESAKTHHTLVRLRGLDAP